MNLAATRLKHHPSRMGLTQEVNGNHVWTGEVRLNEDWLYQPLQWRKPRMIFVCAHGDLFHENVPDVWIDKVFSVIRDCPEHTFQVLTKRPERAKAYLSGFKPARSGSPSDPVDHRPYMTRGGVEPSLRPKGSPLFHKSQGWPLRNVWLGVSVEDQATASWRLPLLLEAPAAVRFASVEPFLSLIHI